MEKTLAFVIEDDEDLALVFTESALAAGYQVETFHTGDEVMARLAEVTPYLIILDLHLPGITGPEILKRIQINEQWRTIKVIIASADDRLAEQYRSQVAMVLLKPISMVQLRDLSQRLLLDTSDK
jgi:CheY-like chemotaxis protein